MKAKVKRGGGFRGLLNYVLGEGKDAERVGGNMAGQDPKELSREFSAVRKLRPDVSRPVWHCSLALPKGDHIDPEKWDAVAADFMERMGFDTETTPWVAVRHQDTDHDHIHIVASRVGIDGKVWLGQWEARRAIEATQELERAHGLTLTPGLGDARAERRSLTDKEINMAVRTNQEPPRQRLQRLLDEAIKDKPTALELAERLQAAGVGVRANLASTGRMSGFSFGVDGVWFKGSDLGAAYKWGGLQKAGVTYDEARDRSGLQRFAAAVADRAERQDVAAGRAADAGGIEAVAGGHFHGDGAGLGAAGPTPSGRDAGAGSIRSGNSHPAQDDGRAGAADERERIERVREQGEEAGLRGGKAFGAHLRVGRDGQQRNLGREANGNPAGQTGAFQKGSFGNGGESGVGSQHTATAGMEASSGIDSGRSRWRSGNGDWASRFRKASAAKQRAKDGSMGRYPVEQGNTKGARVDGADRVAARELDPTAYLEAQGYTVKREGRHLSVQAGGDEVYRVTQQQDGRWLWCDLYGNHGGDNIDLVREMEPSLGYSEAVYRLLGAPTVRQQPRPVPKREPPKLPVESIDARENGRNYLVERGITMETIREAEKSGMLRYTDGAVLFVGYDRSGTAQNATRRATDPHDSVQKRDLRGSDKRYPPILPGNPSKVWIVEGGADALALHDMAKRGGRQPPTVIVSGGANVRGFLENPQVQDILRGAHVVTVALENEKDADTQARTDAGHQKQAQVVAELTGRDVMLWKPKPEQGKDLAEMNARQVDRIERERAVDDVKVSQARSFP